MTKAWHTIRRLRKAPGFSILAVVTLALGIGATTAMFSVVSGILLEPLPFDKSDRLVYISSYFSPETGRDIPDFPVGSPEYFDYKNQNRTMEAVAAVSTEAVSISAGQGRPETVRGGWVSPSMFTVLRTPPLLGRTLIEADGGPEPAPVVVLSHDLWQRRFGGDSTVVGSVIELIARGASPDPIPAEIVGVMPPAFSYPGEGLQLWSPLLLDPARTWRGGHWFRMIGRLAPGVTFQEADREMTAMMRQWAVSYPEHHAGHGLYMQPLLEREVGEAKSALLLLLGAVGFVLLIACANVASLLLARGEARRKELAVRSALGAGRARLFREILSESVVLAVVGGALGLFLAWVGVRGLLALEPGNLPRVEEVGMDGRVLAFTAGATMLTTLLFGLLPALRGAAPKPGDALRNASMGMTAGAQRMRVRRGIVIAEVGLSVLLIVGAGLMVRSLGNLLDEEPGFRTENLLFAQFSLPAGEYSSAEAALFYRELVDRVRSIPGTIGVSRMSRPPLLWENQNARFHIEGKPDEPCCAGSTVSVGEGLLEVLGIEVVRGRSLEAGDFLGDAAKVCLIDEAAAQRYFPTEDPLGHSVLVDMNNPWRIVGVVRNVAFDGPGMVFPTAYLPANRAPGHLARSSYLVIRAQDDPAQIAEPLRRIVSELDPKQAVLSSYTMDGIFARALARPRFIMTLLTLFAGMALFLGAIGIYGVISLGVTLRAGEIGIRRALGAENGTVVGMVAKQGLALAAMGLGLGLTGAYLGSRVMTGFLHEVSPTDPLTFAWAGIGVVLVALTASYIPARRAAKVDPLKALRAE